LKNIKARRTALNCPAIADFFAGPSGRVEREVPKRAMPVFEFRCKKCQAVTEVLCSGAGSVHHGVTCGQCGSKATAKVISRVSFKVAKPVKYSEEFLHKAQPFLRRQKETAGYFAEGKGSEDSRTFDLAERIGEGIDRTLATQVSSRKLK
jgi:putative FmdB family regulatory protein